MLMCQQAIVVTIELPECPSAKTVSLDISEKSLRLTTPAPTNYALDLELTYTIKEVLELYRPFTWLTCCLG